LVAPDDLEVLTLLGSIQSALGLREQADRTFGLRRVVEKRINRIDALTQEIAKRPADPEPRWRLGQAATEAAKKTLAEQSYQAALALDPGCKQARQGLLELGVPEAKIPASPSTKLAGGAADGSPRPVP
jgi:hypothetical protein